jgi:hypothetical protein
MDNKNCKPSYLWGISLPQMFVGITIFMVGLGLVWAIIYKSQSMYADWMRMCVMTQVSTYNKTGDDAFAHCKAWKEWMDHKDQTGWRQ